MRAGSCSGHGPLMASCSFSGHVPLQLLRSLRNETTGSRFTDWKNLSSAFFLNFLNWRQPLLRSETNQLQTWRGENIPWSLSVALGHLFPAVSATFGQSRCSVNKAARHKSWVLNHFGRLTSDIHRCLTLVRTRRRARARSKQASSLALWLPARSSTHPFLEDPDNQKWPQRALRPRSSSRIKGP